MLMPRLGLIVLVFAFASACLNASTIRRGDVVFMYFPEDAALYAQYGGTIQGWGGHPKERAGHSFNWWKKKVDGARAAGLKFVASVDYRVDFKGFIDMFSDSFMQAACVDLDGKPIRVPWLMDHDYEGRKAWDWCTNNPDYKAYLDEQVTRICGVPIDGLHIDDYSGTSSTTAYRGGCFCRHCMEGFRGYLKNAHSPPQLKSMGIKDIRSFDYGAFLRSSGWTTQRLKQERWKAPLREEFQDFQNQRMLENISATFALAEKLQGKRLIRSVNSAANNPLALLPAPHITNFCGEVPQAGETGKVSLAPVYVYRLVEGLGRIQTATASGGDWAWAKANDKPGLVRCWIAQAYAYGSVFMAPNHQWCHTPELGTHWWDPAPASVAPVTKFAVDNRRLLDGYSTLANLALIYSKENYKEVKEAAVLLAKDNIPYAMLVAGDEELPARLTPDLLSWYEYLVKSEKPLPPGQGELVGRSEKPLVYYDALPREVRRQVKVEGSKKVRVSLRFNRSQPSAPLVCHLLNQDYDLKSDDVKPVNVSVILDEKFLKRARVVTPQFAILHQPGQEPQRLQLTRSGSGISFRVRELGVWGIVELK